jgi:hypothetical protein
MSDPGFNVSVRDVYDEVKSLSERVNTFLQNQTTKVALIEQRLDQVEKDLVEDRKAGDEDRRLRVNLRWQMIGVLIAAVLASLLPYLIHH